MISIIAKVRKLASQLNSYHEENQLLSRYPGAYHSGRSTEHILLFAVDTIVNALDHHQIMCVACLDLRRVFDSMDHILLLVQLRY